MRVPREPGVRIKHLDQVVRDYIKPPLGEMGFKKTTRRQFTYENSEGSRAVVLIHSYPLGFADTSFFVDLFIQPRVWREWLIDKDGGPYVHGGFYSERLSPPIGGPFADDNVWQLNIGDLAVGADFAKAIRETVPEWMNLTDSRALLNFMLAAPPYSISTAGGAEIPLAMLGPSRDLDDRLAFLDAQGSMNEFDMPGYLRFIRSWVKRNFPTL